MLRAVLDTVVFVRALINPRSRCGRLLFEYSDRYTIVISKPTAQELLEVIRRPELMAKYRSLANISPGRVIDLLSKAEAVQVDDAPPIVRDPKDDVFVATALAGRADYLVSEDKDLLILGDAAGVPIVNTQTFIDLLESESRSSSRRGRRAGGKG
ncbi:MAG TPA: putative toxin-antitoxin system toxin component, PIN family [Anaerolineae bacterium]|nr:putative toxin-antitoxin system toxin component, PIN family [Anaerolineae bacterium]